MMIRVPQAPALKNAHCHQNEPGVRTEMAITVLLRKKEVLENLAKVFSNGDREKSHTCNSVTSVGSEQLSSLLCY